MPSRSALPALLLLLALDGAAAQQEPLGRLFLTPAQRATLDYQRQRNPERRASLADDDTPLTINGEVRRSAGRTTRWINGEANWENAPPATHGVPVGDTVLPGSGKRERLLGDGKIIVKPGGTAR